MFGIASAAGEPIAEASVACVGGGIASAEEGELVVENDGLSATCVMTVGSWSSSVGDAEEDG